MKISSTILETKSISNCKEAPSLNGLQLLPGGDVVVGTAFGHPLLRRVSFKSGDVFTVVDLKLETDLGADAVAVVGGFKNSEKGDVDLVVLHEGAFPKILRKLFSKNFLDKSGPELIKFLDKQEGSMGAQCSHVQYVDSKFNIRRSKEPGMTWDLHFLGDFVFGLFPMAMWREPYLHLALEKREVLRNDLKGNQQLHRSEDGTFWALSQKNRLMRFQYGENKAKPTPLKLPGTIEEQEFLFSASSTTDSWLYGVSAKGKNLFRVRRNPVSFEEEIQSIWDCPEEITAICVVDRESNSFVAVSTLSPEGAKLYSFEIVKAEDAEMIPDVPVANLLGVLKGVVAVRSLTFDSSQQCLWAAEGTLGLEMAREDKEKLKILRITEL